MENSLEKNNFKSEKSLESKTNIDAFGKRIEDASPDTLNQIWNIMKNKATMAGMLAVAMGSYLFSQLYEPMVVQNILESMKENASNPDPEKIRQVLLGFKMIAGSVAGIGILLTVDGFLDRKKIR